MRGMIVHLPLSTLAARAGEEIGVSDWLVVSQARIDQFADATGDHQWIHLDAARAAAESPYGTTIAHGFLTLSLATTLLADTIAVDGARMIIKYGCDRVRFVSAVPAGSRVRGRFTIAAVENTRDSIQATWGVVIEREGQAKSCLVLDWKVRYYPAAATTP